MPSLDPAPIARPSRSCFSPRGANRIAAALIAIAALTVYARSFSSPFVFDDLAAIKEGNPSIHHLWPLGPVLSPPVADGQTVGGRPVLNLSLAVNYAVSGTGVGSYHAVNLLIHILCGWTLLGIVRRTFLRMSVRVRDPDGPMNAVLFAGAVALLWTVHPLQTESVTYVIQRAESLMSLFYLLTLYGFVRFVAAEPSFDEPVVIARARVAPPAGNSIWMVGSILACYLGMGTKEAMATAPLIVFLYDHTFVAGSWRVAWRRRRWYYLALAAAWIPLGILVAGARGRGGTAGVGGSLSPAAYLRIQCSAVIHYLRLALWPRGLVFDYGAAPLAVPHAAMGAALLVVLAGAVVLALRWRSPLGFLGAWFFVLLAPSSSIVPIEVQPIAEHRMYLALAAVVITVVSAAAWTLGRRALLALVPAVLVLGVLTVRRNEVYRSAAALWGDTAAKRPGNSRAQCNLADALVAEGRAPEALPIYAEALRLELPRAGARGHTVIVDILTNYGNALLAAGRPAEAQARYKQARDFRGRAQSGAGIPAAP